MGHVMFMRKGDVHTTPSPVTKLVYIQSNGTQYVDTGVVPNQNTRIVVDMDVTAQSEQSGLFGSRSGYQSNAYCLWTGSNNAGYQDDYGNKVTNTSTSRNSGGRHLLDKNKNVFSVDGEVVNTSAANTFSGSYPVFLLSVNNAGSPLSAYPTTAKLYSCKIYDNDTLVRDFIPCIYDDAVGLWDKVEEKFYGNAGTGVFIGSEVA